jgi:DUF1009 family protein
MSSEIKKLGIIAGGGLLPRYLAEYCASKSLPYFILALEGFAEVDFIAAHPHAWQNFGKIGQAVERLKEANVTHLTFGGRVERPSLSSLKLDFTGMKLMGRIATLKNHGDDALLKTVMGFMEEQGFTIVSPDSLLTNLGVASGVMTTTKPTASAEEDIKMGIAFLKTIGAFDIGQAVIVQQKKIIAVEGAEGTDRMIARFAPLLLKGEKATLIKIKKPQQDTRADLPAIGPETVRNAHIAGLGGIAIEAGETLVLDKTATLEIANQHHLFIMALHP